MRLNFLLFLVCVYSFQALFSSEKIVINSFNGEKALIETASKNPGRYQIDTIDTFVTKDNQEYKVVFKALVFLSCKTDPIKISVARCHYYFPKSFTEDTARVIFCANFKENKGLIERLWVYSVQNTSKGMGRYLLTRARDLLFALDMLTVSLTVHPFDHKALLFHALVRFYKSVGFAIKSMHFERYDILYLNYIAMRLDAQKEKDGSIVIAKKDHSLSCELASYLKRSHFSDLIFLFQ